VTRIVDVGCGNGRDAIHLANLGFVVTGIDNSSTPPNEPNFSFVQGDFVTADLSDFDLVYSRFSYHSITNEQQALFLTGIPEGAYLALECRAEDATSPHHGCSHYRNPVTQQDLARRLEAMGFTILQAEERRGCAVYKGEDPRCVRVLARRATNEATHAFNVTIDQS
jgi:SAM-dependent methyltransferase